MNKDMIVTGSGLASHCGPQLEFALESVSLAVEVARGIRSDLASAHIEKSDRSPVTVADYSIQALISQRLSQVFPDDHMVAEETSKELRGPAGAGVLAEVVARVGDHAPGVTQEKIWDWLDRGSSHPTRRFWTLDPIDGTKGFLRGGHYAVALGLIENGVVEIEVLGCPHWSVATPWQEKGPGGLVVAVRGGGTWWRPIASDRAFERLRVSAHDRVRDARILRSYESGHTNVDKMERLARELAVEIPPVLMDSQTKYAVLASGQGELLFRLLRTERPEYREKIWDQAAGSIVIEEAGGRITDLEGKQLDFSAGRTLARNTGIIASNGKLHSHGLAALREIQAIPKPI